MVVAETREIEGKSHILNLLKVNPTGFVSA